MLQPHEAGTDGHSQGDGGVWVAERPGAVGRVRSPAGGEVLFFLVDQGILPEGRAFPACGEPPGILEWTLLGPKRAFWVEETPYRDTLVGKAQLYSLTG